MSNGGVLLKFRNLAIFETNDMICRVRARSCVSLCSKVRPLHPFSFIVSHLLLMQAKRLSEICFTSSKIEFPLISKSSLRGLSRQFLKSSCGLLLSGIHASTKVSISLRLSDCRRCSIFSMCSVPAWSNSQASLIWSYCDFEMATYGSDAASQPELQSIGDVDSHMLRQRSGRIVTF